MVEFEFGCAGGFALEELGFRSAVVSLNDGGRDCEELRDDVGAIRVDDPVGMLSERGGVREAEEVDRFWSCCPLHRGSDAELRSRWSSSEGERRGRRERSAGGEGRGTPSNGRCHFDPHSSIRDSPDTSTESTLRRRTRLA